jgi:hypothetical protein
VKGVQIGLVNHAASLRSVQIGLVSHAEDGVLPWTALLNAPRRVPTVLRQHA